MYALCMYGGVCLYVVCHMVLYGMAYQGPDPPAPPRSTCKRKLFPKI